MPKLEKYRHFKGRHHETGSLCNVWAYRGVKAPHTGKPISEALLMGIGGGILMGYFSFAYKGYDPHVVILTRNTFNPMDAMLSRLGVVQHVRQTTNPGKARANLVEALDDGLPAIVWADTYSLPYTGLASDSGMWAMIPIVVYGYDEEGDTVWIADRARVPLTATPGELAAARARVKKDKHRLMTIDPPNLDKLPVAAQQGIWDCIRRYTEAPVAKARNNIGFAGFRRWADLLARPKQRLSWEREFPAGRRMLAGLTSAYRSIAIVPGRGQAERDVYADFLDEASVVLGRSSLKEVAERFRASGRAWAKLAEALLPDAVPAFKQTRLLMQRQHKRFVEAGGAALEDIRKANAELEAIRAKADRSFPLSPEEVAAMRETLRARVDQIHAIEQQAHAALQAAMADGKGVARRRSAG